MEFNSSKCHMIGKSINRPRKTYKMGGEKIKVVHEEKGLVKLQDTLSSEKHINKLFEETYKMLQNIKTSFNFMEKEMMRKIKATMIRSKLEYTSVMWLPHKKKEIGKLERIKRISTKLVPKISNTTYKDRLREMELPTSEQRRERGDMITSYRFVNKIEKIDKDDLLVSARSQGLRGHGKKLRKGNCLKGFERV